MSALNKSVPTASLGRPNPSKKLINMSLSNRSMKIVQDESKYNKGGPEILAAGLEENHLSN
jgi:hypothetical protein